MRTNTSTFQITKLLNRFLMRWPQIILWGVIGVILAFGISFILPSRYESSAALAVSVDFGRTTEVLDLVTEERVLDRVRQLMLSDETLFQTRDALIAEYGTSEDWDSIDSLRRHLRLDARLSRWETIGIHTDPVVASVIANVWQDVILSRLDDAIDHAWRAQSLQGVRFEVGCVLLLTNESYDAIYRCVSTGPEVSLETIEKLKYEIEASHGILPIIQYESVHQAVPPDLPVLWPRGLLLFSGGMIGFIVGCLVVLRPDKTEIETRGESGKSSRSGSPTV